MELHIFGIFCFFSEPLHSKLFEQSKSGYVFYPFNYKGSIFTIDSMLWKGKDNIELLYPSTELIKEYITNKTYLKKNKILFALHRGNLPNKLINVWGNEFNIVPQYLNGLFNMNYKFIGYDIVDSSGLSGL